MEPMQAAEARLLAVALLSTLQRWTLSLTRPQRPVIKVINQLIN
jgi:hypothetical protein